MRRLWLLVAAVAFGCSIPVVEQVPLPAVAPLPPGTTSRTLILDRVVFDVPKGTTIGERRGGLACVGAEKIVWQAERRTFGEGPYHSEFDSVASTNNFKVPERATSLFPERTPTGTELLVAARIPMVEENRCTASDFWKARPVHKGSVRLFVHWEVYSLAERRVLLALESVGTAALDEFRPMAEESYYVRAFGNAVRALLGHENFRRLVIGGPSARQQADPL